jgi:hypothetical protein
MDRRLDWIGSDRMDRKVWIGNGAITAIQKLELEHDDTEGTNKDYLPLQQSLSPVIKLAHPSSRIEVVMHIVESIASYEILRRTMWAHQQPPNSAFNIATRHFSVISWKIREEKRIADDG